MQRRQVLALAGAGGIAGLAGCLDSLQALRGNDPEENDTPDGETDETPDLPSLDTLAEVNVLNSIEGQVIDVDVRAVDDGDVLFEDSFTLENEEDTDVLLTKAVEGIPGSLDGATAVEVRANDQDWVRFDREDLNEEMDERDLESDDCFHITALVPRCPNSAGGCRIEYVFFVDQSEHC